MTQFKINQNEEKAWVTFLVDDNGDTGVWEKEWFPVVVNGIHLDFDEEDTMTICRIVFGEAVKARTFGIAPTSQMLLGNSVRDNI